MEKSHSECCVLYQDTGLRLFPISVIHLSTVCPTLHTWGQILEKGGGFAVRIFPEGWVLSRDCPNPLNHIYIIFHCVKYLWKILCEFHRYPYLPVKHCAQQGGMGYL